MAPSTVAMPTEIPRAEPGAEAADTSSRELHERLNTSGPEREAAVVELHALLLKAARFEVSRRRDSLPHLRGGDHEDLAQQSADDALLAVLGKLGEFRGESRFTTWAYKFALLEAGVKMRRRAWQGREVPLEDEAWSVLADARRGVAHETETRDLIEALGEEIEHSLSAHQRAVLVAVTLNDVPIDVLAERLDSSRGALYKTLHDARRKLRGALAERGLDVGGNDRSEER
jgi:RNA polymerase sigma-70 factor (ECF subfamily)